MLLSAIGRFTDPDQYRTFHRAGDVEHIVTGSGKYRSELTRIDLHHLWMQRGSASLPVIERGAVNVNRGSVGFLADADHAPISFTGMEVTPGVIVFIPPFAEYYHCSATQSHWGSLSLTPDDLAIAARSLAGHDLSAKAVLRVIRPSPQLMSRLRRLHEEASHLAATAPDILAHPEVARAMEQELIRVMVGCLTDGEAKEVKDFRHRRVPVMHRFEEVLEANRDSPLYMADVCNRIGVSDRTLRMHCLEQLGISPHRYLWLRRMNLARWALARASSEEKTVTQIANDHGFGELGCFSVSYRRLFGESPSATLRHAPADQHEAYPGHELMYPASVIL